LEALPCGGFLFSRTHGFAVQVRTAINFAAMEQLIRIEHIGIAVKDLATAEALYTKLLGAEPYKREAVESEGVITSFFKTGPNKIELLESTRPDGLIAKAIEKRGEGIHHIAFEVADIRAEMARLKAQGFTLLNEEPKPGADNKLVCFIHPKSAGGVLVELCQEIR
jgi:methylmalonyl-CoA/ethylmalonyl-CoA epimerase